MTILGGLILLMMAAIAVGKYKYKNPAIAYVMVGLIALLQAGLVTFVMLTMQPPTP